jgi:hypothetical protein
LHEAALIDSLWAGGAPVFAGTRTLGRDRRGQDSDEREEKKFSKCWLHVWMVTCFSELYRVKERLSWRESSYLRTACY